MKNSLLFLLLLSLVLFSCKKDEEEVIPDPYDNITVSQTQEAFVLLTTATWCGYCGEWGIPTFEEAFAGSDGIDAARVNGLALHYSSSDPMYLAMSQTLKTQYGIGGPPNLWIEFNNAYNLMPSSWKNAIKTRQAQTAPKSGVGMYVEYASGKYTVYTKVKYFASLSGTYNLAIYATQNGIVNPQSHNIDGTIANYVHNEVLRGEITANSPYGVQLFSGSSPSTEYKATYTYTPPSSIPASNIHFVAVIYEMSGGVPISTVNSNTY